MRQDAKFVAAGVLLGLVGCGRSPIYCARRGATRPCQTECGGGEQTCDGFEYGECVRPCSNACGSGVEHCIDGEWVDCDAPTPELEATVRDFHDSHPDFQVPFSAGVEQGIVGVALGPDGLPVYLGGQDGTRTTTGLANFRQWFTNAPGTNAPGPLLLDLENLDDDPPRLGLNEEEFFPIDGEFFGNEGYRHNYHFTLHIEGEVLYGGGERLEFASDDDLWVFINGRLAVDLGGTHSADEGVEFELDTLAPFLGMDPGHSYPIDLFFAERHTTSSALVFSMPSAMLSCPG